VIRSELIKILPLSPGLPLIPGVPGKPVAPSCPLSPTMYNIMITDFSYR